MRFGRRLAGSLIAGLVALVVLAAPAVAASPVVDLVDRLVPAHADLDIARDAFAHARAAGDGTAAARAAARAYADASDEFADRTSAVAVRSGEERDLRAAMSGASRTLADDLRAYAGGAIDGAELDRRSAATRARSADRIAALVPALAGQEGIDDSVGAKSMFTAFGPVLLLVIGVVGVAALTRRRSAVRRSRLL
ncbi:MAG TPA: hypothetical protein VL422_08290 [Miltoncostaea sp.]|nr:hypothetical protein [Miltoncostaea sp.]